MIEPGLPMFVIQTLTNRAQPDAHTDDRKR